jgi:Zn-finger nucleic acid-binding protein
MGIIRFTKSLISSRGTDDSKNFTLILSAIISFFVGLVVCFSIVFDVITNGYIKSDLEEVGIFMLCVGGYMAGGSVSKIFGDKYEGKTVRYRELLDHEAEMEYNDEADERVQRAKKRRKDRSKMREEYMKPDMPPDDVDVLAE